MKKMFLLVFVAMVAMGASAQMNVWENGGLSAQYAIESVDSVTFGITSVTPSSGSGKDGITPLLKIENDYWYVSYDEGQTWQQEGRATGEDGDSMFQSVTQDENYVYFTLADGSVIKIPKGNGNQSSMGDGYVTSGKADGYYYVDLDLPSGTKWATCNVGSNLVAGPGYFFAWGETIRKSEYSKESYTLNIYDLPDTIYHTEYDAATINWGSKWATPTKEHWEELLRWANWTYTSYNDIKGWKISGPNGNSIFLPAVGSSVCPKGFLHYLSSSRSSSSEFVYGLCNTNYDATKTPQSDPCMLPWLAQDAYYGKNQHMWFYYYCGYPIRPVLVENE